MPILGQPAPLATARELVGLRLRRAARIAAARWAGASIGGGLAGVVGGAVGGLILAAAPGSAAPLAVAPVLAVIGGCCGAAGGAGVGAGLSVAEVDRAIAADASRSSAARRSAAASSASSRSGSADGASRRSWACNVDIGGGLEGLVIGGAAGLGYAPGHVARRTAGWPRRAAAGDCAPPR